MEQNSAGPKDPKDPRGIVDNIRMLILNSAGGPMDYFTKVEYKPANSLIVEKLSLLADFIPGGASDPGPSRSFYHGTMIGLDIAMKTTNIEEARRLPGYLSELITDLIFQNRDQGRKPVKPATELMFRAAQGVSGNEEYVKELVFLIDYIHGINPEESEDYLLHGTTLVLYAVKEVRKLLAEEKAVTQACLTMDRLDREGGIAEYLRRL